MMEIQVREANPTDWPAVIAIYNQAIKTGISTAETILVSIADKKQWLEEHLSDRSPLLVAVNGEEVIGWVSLSDYRKGRQALQHTAEISYYVHGDHLQKGIGTLLVKTMLDKAKLLSYKNLVAILIHVNIGSIKLLQKFGFEQWGSMPGIVEMGDKLYDHVYYGRKL